MVDLTLLRRVAGAFAGLCALVVAATITAQNPPVAAGQSVFRAETTLVPVDVRVLDRKGKPVTDLLESDFTILEDKVPQRLGHFSTQAFTPEPPVTSSGPRLAADALDLTSQNQRTFLIVLGRGRLQPPAGGVDGMLHFVRTRLLPQDLVAVLAWNRATDFTTDHERIATLLERFKRGHERIESLMGMRFSGLAAIYGSPEIPAGIQRDIDAVFGGPRAEGVRTMAPAEVRNAARIEEDTRRTTDLLMPGARLTSVDQALVSQMGASLDEFVQTNTQSMQDLGLLYTGIHYLRHLAGEKHLIFLTVGGLSLPRVEDDRDIGRVAADARVALDIIHTGGVGGILQAMTSYTLADMTGGRFYANRFKNASVDADYMDQAARFQYVLGYYPTKPWDGKYRKITVKVNRPGLTVLYRNGYFARAEIAPVDRKGMMVYSRVASASMYAAPIADIGVTVNRAAVGMTGKTGKVDVEMTIDLSHVAFEKQGARNVASIEVAVFCVTRSQDNVGHSWQTVELNFSDDRLTQMRRDRLTHNVTIPVTSAPRDIKVVVYDYGADLVGSVVAKVTER